MAKGNWRGWDEETIALLCKLVADGLPFSAIAERMGAPSRSIPLAKAYRLGLKVNSARAKRQKPGPKKRKHAHGQDRSGSNARFGTISRSKPNVAPQPHVAEPDLFIPVAERRTLDDLTHTCCRWPYGDPKAADFYYCGDPKAADFYYCGKTKVPIPSAPYCEFHMRRAHQRVDKPRRNKEDIVVPRALSSVS